MKKENLNQVSLAELLFDVEINDNPRNTNSEYCKVVTGYIDGQEIDLNYCSDRYELVPNQEIFPKVREILFNNNIVFTEKYYSLNNARFYGEIVIENPEYAYKVAGSSDVVKPMLKIQHSYNGLTKYMINFGYYRLVCTNGLTIAVKEMKQYNLHVTGKHTASIKNSLEKLDETLKYFAANAAQITTAITAKYDRLAGNWVENVNDRLTEVLNNNGITIIENNKFDTMNYLNQVIDTEKHLFNNKVNDWLVYNAINAYINDEKLNVKAPEIRAKKDSEVFEFMLS